jgi:hypothetical protein
MANTVAGPSGRTLEDAITRTPTKKKKKNKEGQTLEDLNKDS